MAILQMFHTNYLDFFLCGFTVKTFYIIQIRSQQQARITSSIHEAS